MASNQNLNPTPDQLVIKVRFIGLDPFVDRSDSFLLAAFPISSQKHYGFEIAGEVESCGSLAQSQFARGQKVIGLLPPDYSVQNMTPVISVPFYYFTAIPESASMSDTLSILGPGLRAFSSLFYKAKITAGDSVLVLNSTLVESQISIQLLHLWKAQIYLVVDNKEQADLLSKKYPHVSYQLINLSESPDLRATILNKTKDVGVDVILDNYSDFRPQKFTNLELFKSLSAGGTLVTHNYRLQVDPPESSILFFKNCSISWNFEHAWVLASDQLGRLQHVFQEILKHYERRELFKSETCVMSVQLSKMSPDYETQLLANALKVMKVDENLKDPIKSDSINQQIFASNQ